MEIAQAFLFALNLAVAGVLTLVPSISQVSNRDAAFAIGIAVLLILNCIV